MFSDLLFRLRALFRRDVVETELHEELRFHFEQQVAKYVAAGVTREEALRRARLAFGGLDQVKEECRDARGVSFLENLAQDVRYGWRMLRKNPGFTASAVLILALGVGASTAIFSLMDVVLLQSLLVRNPEELVALSSGDGHSYADLSFSYPAYRDIRDQNQVFAGVIAHSGAGFNASYAGGNEKI